MAEPQLIPTVYPVAISGQRVRIREVNDDAFDAAWTWASRSEFFRFLPIDQPTREDERAWLESVIAEGRAVPRRQYQLGIDAPEVGSLVGMVRIGVDSERHRSASIGYGISPDFWGRGYATEARLTSHLA